MNTPDTKNAHEKGSNNTPSARYYRFNPRDTRTKKSVEAVKHLRGLKKLTPEMKSAVAYFLQ